MKYIASISFGKDSLAMLLKIIEKKLPLDEVVFCEVMTNDDESAEFPEMKEFINNTEKLLKEKYDITVKHVRSEYTFESVFYQKKQRGKFKGTNYGFPMTLKAWCNDRLKMKPLDNYFKSQGNHTRYIGIAADEPKRLARLEKNELAPLAMYGIDEEQAKQICIDNNMLAPLYSKFKRIGCWFCPKQNLKTLRVLRKEYPKLWEKLLKWQKDSNTSFKIRYTMQELEEKFSNEDFQ